MDRFTYQTQVHAEGGFGKILRGRDNVLERDIAVKVLSPLASAITDNHLERFRREAKILASLSHPNIPSIYDVKFDKSEFLIFFQFIHGKTLRQLLDKEGAAPLTQARLWFTQIASALEHAHANNVIHRDVKPDNIIITENRETAYLVDFGIALTPE